METCFIKMETCFDKTRFRFGEFYWNYLTGHPEKHVPWIHVSVRFFHRFMIATSWELQ